MCGWVKTKVTKRPAGDRGLIIYRTVLIIEMFLLNGIAILLAHSDGFMRNVNSWGIICVRKII